ncbi:MAG: SGNH/GDSL hydrolase family protein [Planctomycetaceae bacterium]|nr:SGNH/GDSL hydrolase family protein [Planctomycetaceae bacterium]
MRTGWKLPLGALGAFVLLILLEAGVRAGPGFGWGSLDSLTRPWSTQVVEGAVWGRGPLSSWLHPPGARAVLEQPDGTRVLLTANSRGFRDLEWEEKGDRGALRVLVLGDSHASQVTIPTESLWPQRLEPLLGGPDRGASVFNLAVGGLTTAHQYELLQRIGPLLDPDVVIVQFTSGDVRGVSAFPALVDFHRGTRIQYLDPADRLALRKDVDERFMDPSLRVCRVSHLARALRSLRGKPVGYSMPMDLGRRPLQAKDAARRRTLAYLGGIAGLCRSTGAALVIIFDRGVDRSKGHTLQDLEWVKARLLPGQGVFVLDTDPGFEGLVRERGLRQEDGEHLTVEGHAAFADWVVRSGVLSGAR